MVRKGNVNVPPPPHRRKADKHVYILCELTLSCCAMLCCDDDDDGNDDWTEWHGNKIVLSGRLTALLRVCLSAFQPLTDNNNDDHIEKWKKER